MKSERSNFAASKMGQVSIWRLQRVVAPRKADTGVIMFNHVVETEVSATKEEQNIMTTKEKLLKESGESLSRLLAAYMATSQDKLAKGFRTYYAEATGTASAELSAGKQNRGTLCKKDKMRPTDATFRYVWLKTAPEKIVALYERLIGEKWIDRDTDPDDFYALFAGEESACKIRWTGKKTVLVYLMKLLKERQYVRLPRGRGIWEVTGSHFLDADGRYFKRLRCVRMPIRQKYKAEAIAELMNGEK